MIVGAEDPATGSTKRSFAFQYRGARYDRLGRGWLGFSKRIVWEGMGPGLAWAKRTEIAYDNRTYDASRRRYPFAGRPVRTTIAHGALRSYGHSATCDVFEATSAPAMHATAGGASYFVFDPWRSERRAATLNHRCTRYFGDKGSGLDMSRVPLLVDTLTGVQVDDFGNALSTSTRFADGGMSTTSRTYAPDPSRWLVAEETRAVTCGLEAGQASSCRTTAYPSYDSRGLLAAATLQEGDAFRQLDVTFERDRFGNVTKTMATDARTRRARVTRAAFDDEGLFPSVSVDELGHATRRAFDPARGLLLTEMDPNGLVTQRSFDGFGRLGREVRPDGTETRVSFRRDDLGAPGRPKWRMGVHATTTSGEETDVLADEHGRPQRIESFAFDSPDNPAGKKLVRYLAYDPLVEKVASRTIPATPAANPSGVPREVMVYDSRGRTLFDTAPDGARTAYHYENLITHVIDPSSRRRTTTLDSHGRVIVVSEGALDDVRTTYRYDSTGAVREVVDPAGHVTQLVNDVLGSPRIVVDPDRGTFAQTFDAFGELTGSTEANGTATAIDYDAAGRPVHRESTYDRGRSRDRADWCWDVGPGRGIGQLAATLAVQGERALRAEPAGCDAIAGRAPEGATEQMYGYDELGRAAAFGQATGEDTFVFRYAYNEAGHLASIAYPQVGGSRRDGGVRPSVALAYDAHGALREARNTTPGTAPGASLLWEAERSDSAGRLWQEQFGGGATRTTSRYEETTGRLRQRVTMTGAEPPVSPAGRIQDLRYTYFPNGDLQTRSDLRQSAAPGARDVTETFAYDDLDRLTSVTLAATGAVDETHYDVLGNITSKTGVGAYAYDYAAHPHQVTRITRPDGGVDRYGYDPSGDEIERPGSLGIAYTSFHLPSRVQTRDANVHIAYDAMQGRVQKESDAQTITYVAGLYERVESHGPGRSDVEHRVYVPGPGRPVAILKFHEGEDARTPETLFVHLDALGSLDALSDVKGRVVERHAYDAFGAPRDPDWTRRGPAPPERDGSTLGFTGQEDDPELGLVNMRGRLYDPRLGRFLSADPHTPSATSLGWNRYAYANDNPLRFVDPSGFEGEDYGASDYSAGGGGGGYGGSGGGGPFLAPPNMYGISLDGSFVQFAFPGDFGSGASGLSNGDSIATATASGADAGGIQTDSYANAPGTVLEGDAWRTDSAPRLAFPTLDQSWSAAKAGMFNGAIEMVAGVFSMGYGSWAPSYQQWIGANVLSRIKMDIPTGHVADDYQAGKNVTLTIVTALGVVAPMMLEGAVVGEGAAIEGAGAEAAPALEEGAFSKIAQFSEHNLQKGFTKHGADFEMAGNWNPARGADFSRTVNMHLNDPAVVEIAGTYRGAPVTHFYNPATGVNVMLNPAGQYVSGWRLGAGQLETLLRYGGVQ